MTKKLLFVTTVLLALSLAAMAANVDGKWVYEQQGRNGAQQVTLTLKAEGSNLTGSVARPGRGGETMTTAIKDGKVDGNNISFKVTQQMGGNEFTSEYTGVVSGDEIKLKVTRPGRDGNAMTNEYTAKRSTT